MGTNNYLIFAFLLNYTHFFIICVYKSSSSEADGKMKGQVDRLVNIWKERGVFNADFTNQLKKTLGIFFFARNSCYKMLNISTGISLLILHIFHGFKY